MLFRKGKAQSGRQLRPAAGVPRRGAAPPRIGIYAGTFDPVHGGHVAFALQAVKEARLDVLYFLPERRPRHKRGVEHLGHRIAMLQTAVRPHPSLQVLETDDISFSVARTLPRLQRCFAGSQLVFLFGSDVAQHIHEWPLAENLLTRAEIVVGLRGSGAGRSDMEQILAGWPVGLRRPLLVRSCEPDVSSHSVRQALATRTHVRGLLRSVAAYSNRHWLYVSLAKIIVDKA
ncbi:MAG TPA: nicotinate-nicotinamide nucleotide adenylyltransferase [Candidatus Saccharimonadales bacterium]